jgi:hypothetical protein
MLARMRSAAFALVLAACGAAQNPSAAPHTAEEAAPHAHIAASDATRDVTGALTIERGGLVFARGATLYTRVLEPRGAHDLVADGGPSFGEAAGVYASPVELRRVTQQVGGAVCGEAEPGYVALMREGGALTLLVFEGDEPPSADAAESHICAVYAYAD